MRREIHEVRDVQLDRHPHRVVRHDLDRRPRGPVVVRQLHVEEVLGSRARVVARHPTGVAQHRVGRAAQIERRRRRPRRATVHVTRVAILGQEAGAGTVKVLSRLAIRTIAGRLRTLPATAGQRRVVLKRPAQVRLEIVFENADKRADERHVRRRLAGVGSEHRARYSASGREVILRSITTCRRRQRGRPKFSGRRCERHSQELAIVVAVIELRGVGNQGVVAGEDLDIDVGRLARGDELRHAARHVDGQGREKRREVAGELDLINADAAFVRTPRRTEIEPDRHDVREVQAGAVVEEIGQANANRFEVVVPTGPGSRAGPLVRVFQSAAIGADVDRTGDVVRVPQRDGERQVLKHSGRKRVPRALAGAEREVQVILEVAEVGDDLPLYVAIHSVPVEDDAARRVRRAAIGHAVHRVGGRPGERRVAVVQAIFEKVRSRIADRAAGTADERGRLRLVVIDEEIAFVSHVAVRVVHDYGVVAGHGAEQRRGADGLELLPLPPEEILAGNVAFKVVLDHGQEEALLDQVRAGAPDQAGARRHGAAATIVQVTVPHAVQNGRVAEAGGAVMQVEGLRDVVAWGAGHIGVRSGRPEMVIDTVRVGVVGPEEIGRGHAGQ